MGTFHVCKSKNRHVTLVINYNIPYFGCPAKSVGNNAKIDNFILLIHHTGMAPNEQTCDELVSCYTI